MPSASSPMASSVAGSSACAIDPPPPRVLLAQPLTQAAFAPFGDVIESAARSAMAINAGMTQRYHDLARVDMAAHSHVLVNIFETQPYDMPLCVSMLERHPLGTQAFIPMDGSAFLVVVAPAGETIEPSSIQAFITNGRQGVNYGRGVWHHPLVVTGRAASFVVVDRGGEGPNCDEQHFSPDQRVLVQLPCAGDQPAAQ